MAILTMDVLSRALTSHQLLNKPFHVKTLNTAERLTISATASGVTVAGRTRRMSCRPTGRPTTA